MCHRFTSLALIMFDDFLTKRYINAVLLAKNVQIFPTIRVDILLQVFVVVSVYCSLLNTLYIEITLY